MKKIIIVVKSLLVFVTKSDNDVIRNITCSMLSGGLVDVGLAPVTVARRWIVSRVFGRMRRTLAGDAAPGKAEVVSPLDKEGPLLSGRKLSSSVSLSLSISEGNSVVVTSAKL